VRELVPPTAQASARQPSLVVQWLRLVLTLVSGYWLTRVRPLWSVALATLALLAASPVGLSGYLEQSVHATCSSQGGCGVGTIGASSSEQRNRLVNPVGAVPDCEQSAIADSAEEVEVEALSAPNRTERLGVPTCSARELSGSRSSYVSIGLVEWLREHHAPRGPPSL
jgi:hypothetical protein